MSVEALYQEVDSARTSWQDLLSQLANGEADFARSRSVLSDVSLRDFSRQVDLVFELLLSVRPSDGASVSAMVLAAHEANLRPQLQSIASHCTTALNQLRPNWRENTKVADANDAFALQLLADGVAYVAVDLTAYFKHVRAASHALLQTLGAVLPLCKANAITDLSARSESLGDVVRQVDVLRRQAEKSANIAMSFEAKGEKVESGIRELLATTETIVANVRELQLQATTDSSAVSTLVEQIKTIGSVANSLEATVDSYKSKFEAFHAELDERNAAFVRFEEQTKVAREKSVARENDIDRLTSLADAMISGSTTAGLSNSLEKTRERYEDRMNKARMGFVGSVILLGLTAVPLAAHLLPGLFGSIFPTATDVAHNTWYGVLGKVLLMVPATWLTGFFTKSFADFFHLEREYAHKAALAMSVDGFKRQAPKYEEEITAEVFLEIRNNPAKGTSVEPAAHPLYDVLAKVVGKVLQKGKGGE